MRRIIVFGLLILAAVYAASPYFTLWRLRSAIEQKDTFALERLVDWPRVKEGLRGEVQTIFATIMQGQNAGEDNAFAQGLAAVIGPAMVNQLVDANVTSTELIRATEQPASALNPKKLKLNYAFFVSPMAFRADFISGAAADGTKLPFSIFLEFNGTGWAVTHVTFPRDQILAVISEQKATAKGNETPNSQPDLMAPGPLVDMTLGRVDAPNTIVEYASMTDTHSADFHTAVFPSIKSKYIDTGQARLILREFPLDGLAVAAFMLARCAGPDRYYPMVGALFETQETWAEPGADGKEKLLLIAKQAGFSKEQFDQCLADKELFQKIADTRTRGNEEFGVDSTPSFFVNGKRLTGDHQFKDFELALRP